MIGNILLTSSDEKQLVVAHAVTERRGVARECPASVGAGRQYGFTAACVNKNMGLE
jgi:hypothetical protein